MSFVGGGGNVSIATALPPSSFVGEENVISITCRSLGFPDLVTLSCCAGARCLIPEGCLHTYEMVTEHFFNPNLSMVVAKCFF